ncbi:transcriptional regulator LrhA, partial [Klebsiella pneumoniae]
QAIFQSLSQESDPWRAGPALTPEEGGSTFIL